MSSDLITRAESWISGDPDPETREELTGLVESGDMDRLAARMNGTLEFGTAGIRGEVAAGPNRMNRAVVIRTTRGLVDYLIDHHDGTPQSPIVIGFDARPSSRQFAEDAAGVFAAAGIGVVYFPDVIPTPLVAFAARELQAAAAVVVTASHNPPADNGYKVYAGNAAQIIPPADAQIAAAIAEVGPANEVPRVEACFTDACDQVVEVPGDIVDRYIEEVERARPEPRASSLTIVYSAMHGVGGAILRELFERAGHSGLMPVPEQAEPDGTFPTVTFPNPEEEGALDLAIDLADSEGADLIIANDPDADRLAAVIPWRGSWRPLSGNEVGVLLGDYVLRNHRGDKRPIVINSIVSSPMLGRLADVHDAHFERTLTGFKWIANAALSLEEQGTGEFVFGYEEALGYTVGRTVRDKDGISAALVFTDLVAGLAQDGSGLVARLEELWRKAGVWASAQHSIVRKGAAGQEAIQDAITAIGDDPPASIAGHDVTQVADYRTGAEHRPSWLGNQNLIELSLGDRGRILVRPSGTEPKLKIYVDLAADAESDVVQQQADLGKSADTLAKAVEELLPI